MASRSVSTKGVVAALAAKLVKLEGTRERARQLEQQCERLQARIDKLRQEEGQQGLRAMGQAELLGIEDSAGLVEAQESNTHGLRDAVEAARKGVKKG